MKYLKKFENHSQYESYINGGGVVLPNVSYCATEGDVHYNPIPHNYLNDYLTFVALEDTTFKLTIGSAVSESILSSISYSTDNGETWTTTNNVESETVTITTPTIHEGDKVLWKGNGTGVSTITDNSNRSSTSSIFSSSGEFNVEGNIMSLIYGDDFSDKDSVEGTYNFALLFYSYNTTDTAKVVSAKDMVLPIKSVPICCYFRMFQACSSLVEAPSVIDAESVGASGCMSTFLSCINLETAPELSATTLGAESYRAMFQECTSLMFAPELKAITMESNSCYSIFSGCTNLQSAIIKNGIISDNSFKYCNSLTSVTIGSGVTSIGVSAFCECSGLTSINIPDTVTSIGNSAFANCSGITEVDIPDSVTSIGSSAFSRCFSITAVTLSNSLTGINGNTFYICKNLTNITIPNGVTYIGAEAFYGCYKLEHITLPNSITDLYFNCFGSCHSLTSVGGVGSGASVEIPSGVTLLPEYCFRFSSGLTSVVVPDNVVTLDKFAFGDCNNLTTVTIGSGVTNIKNYAFEYDRKLTSITCNATVAPTITETVFQNIKTGGTLYVPNGSSGYDTWMGTGNYYLGKYGWTKVEQ